MAKVCRQCCTERSKEQGALTRCAQAQIVKVAADAQSGTVRRQTGGAAAVSYRPPEIVQQTVERRTSDLLHTNNACDDCAFAVRAHTRSATQDHSEIGLLCCKL